MELLQTICRICESQDNLCDLTNKLNESVSEKLASLTTIRIQLDDPLPRCICVDCVNTLNVAYEFLLRCEAAEQRLQEEFQQQQQQQAEVDGGPLDGTDVDLLIEEVVVDRDIETTVEYVVELHGEDNQQELEHNVDELVEQSDEEASNDAAQEEVVGIYTEQNLDGTENDVKIFYGGVPIKYAIEGLLEEENVLEEQHDTEFSLKQDEEANFLEEEATQQRYDRDKKFHCETCSASFDKCTDLYQHVKTHGKARYQCKDCDRWFSRRQHLYSHEVIHTGERNFRCQSCPNSYTSNRNLRRHIKSAHLGEKPFVCDLCGKEFSQKTVLEAHHSTHIQERPFSCEVCLKTFKSKKLLKLHVSRHSRPEQQQPAVKQEPEPLECDVCHKFYSTKLSLRSHKQVHSDAKIMCSFCGKSFKIMTHLKVHLRSHTKEQPYECKECHKKFGYETSLKSHLLLHTNERPYKCDVCNVSFRQLNHLKGHKFLHSGEKPFTCVVCNKAFALRGNLTIHMRIHGGPGSSPFQCRLCEGKRLNDSNALKRHLKVHPGGKVIKSGSLTVIVAEAEPSGEEDAEEEEDDGGDGGFFLGGDPLDAAGIGIEGALLS